MFVLSFLRVSAFLHSQDPQRTFYGASADAPRPFLPKPVLKPLVAAPIGSQPANCGICAPVHSHCPMPSRGKRDLKHRAARLDCRRRDSELGSRLMGFRSLALRDRPLEYNPHRVLNMMDGFALGCNGSVVRLWSVRVSGRWSFIRLPLVASR